MKTGGGSKKKSRKKRRAKSGIPFEQRAAYAMSVANPQLEVKHNLKLPTAYGRTRQFDVGLLDGTEPKKLYEAKDYSRAVSFTQVEAFETKLSELKKPPTEGGGLISAKGFQQGPIDRAHFYGDAKRARELYQLRTTEETDWKNRFGKLQFAINARQLQTTNVRFTIRGPTKTNTADRCLSRDESFLFDASGAIVGNLLDEMNAFLRALPQAPGDTPLEYGPQSIDYPDERYIALGDDHVRLLRVDFTPSPAVHDGNISVDIKSAARDTLIDCLKERKWIIPDPERVLDASRTGHDLTFAFKKGGSVSVADLAPQQDDTGGTSSLSEIANALALQAVLRSLRALGKGNEVVPEFLQTKLRAAANALVVGDDQTAEKEYLETLETGTSIEALVNLTSIYHRRGNIDEALRFASQTAYVFPLEVEGFANTATILIEAKRYDEAADVLSRGEVFHAGRPELLQHRADLFMRREKWADAYRILLDLRSIESENPAHHLALAFCERKLGRLPHAAFDALAAWRTGKTTPSQNVRVLDILLSAQQYQTTVNVGREALSRDTGDKLDELLMKVAAASYEIRDLAYVRELRSRLSDAVAGRFFIDGLLHSNDGEHRKAYDEFVRYQALRPDDPAVLNNVAIAATRAGLYAEAHAVFKAEVFAAVDTADYWRQRAMAATRARDVNDGALAIRRAKERGVDAAALSFAAIDAAVQLDDISSANAFTSLALAFESSDPVIIARQAVIQIDIALMNDGDVTTGMALLERAEQLGGRTEVVAFGRLLGTLRRNPNDPIVEELMRDFASAWSEDWRSRAAAATELSGRSDLTLRLLEGRTFPNNMDPWPWPRPEALLASALLNSGEWGQFEAMLPLVEALPVHPFHLVVRAYAAYVQGDPKTTCDLLDQAQALFPPDAQIHPELQLRMQSLIEMARYADAAALVDRYVPAAPIKGALERWGNLNVGQVIALIEKTDAAEPGFKNSLGMCAQMYRTDHVVLTLKGETLGRVVVAAGDWESAFKMIAEAGGGIPVFVRVVDRPMRSVQRIRRVSLPSARPGA